MLLGEDLLVLVERADHAVDRGYGRPELVGRERRELALQLVEPPELAVCDRPLEASYGDARGRAPSASRYA